MEGANQNCGRFTWFTRYPYKLGVAGFSFLLAVDILDELVYLGNTVTTKHLYCQKCNACHIYYGDESPWQSGCRRIVSIDEEGYIERCAGELKLSEVKPAVNKISDDIKHVPKLNKTKHREVTCSKCGKTGHNKRTCKQT